MSMFEVLENRLFACRSSHMAWPSRVFFTPRKSGLDSTNGMWKTRAEEGGGLRVFIWWVFEPTPLKNMQKI